VAMTLLQGPAIDAHLHFNQSKSDESHNKRIEWWVIRGEEEVLLIQISRENNKKARLKTKYNRN
jgi:hypothetical protein